MSKGPFADSSNFTCSARNIKISQYVSYAIIKNTGIAQGGVSARMTNVKKYALILTGLTVITILGLNYKHIKPLLIELFKFIDTHQQVGAFVAVIVFGILSALLIPTTLPTILCGIVFPIWLAIIVSELGHQFGILISFLFGRLWLHQ